MREKLNLSALAWLAWGQARSTPATRERPAVRRLHPPRGSVAPGGRWEADLGCGPCPSSRLVLRVLQPAGAASSRRFAISRSKQLRWRCDSAKTPRPARCSSPPKCVTADFTALRQCPSARSLHQGGVLRALPLPHVGREPSSVYREILPDALLFLSVFDRAVRRYRVRRCHLFLRGLLARSAHPARPAASMLLAQSGPLRLGRAVLLPVARQDGLWPERDAVPVDAAQAADLGRAHRART
jgi:hypothetical protein